MYKVVILGCENSHADSFLTHIIEKKAVNDVEVIGVFSEESAAMDKLSEQFGVYKMKNYDEFVGKVDGVIITARHGGRHYKYAKPYIKSGVPMFIDKPITVTEEEAVEFMRELRDNDVKACGGSMVVFDEFVQELKDDVKNKTYGDVHGGFVRAPLSVDNPHGGFFFYSQHLAQTVAEIFGHFPKSVKMFENNRARNGIIRYDDYDVSINYVVESGLYVAGISCQDKFKAAEFKFQNGFATEFDEFYKMLKGGEQPCSYEQLIAPVFVLNAMHRSLLSGKEEKVNEIKL